MVKGQFHFPLQGQTLAMHRSAGQLSLAIFSVKKLTSFVC